MTVIAIDYTPAVRQQAGIGRIIRGQIEALVAAEGMENAVNLLGWQDESGVRAAMNAAHALVTDLLEDLPA